MAGTEAEKEFRLVHNLVDTVKELLALEGALKFLANSGNERAQMAAERKQHDEEMARLGVERQKAADSLTQVKSAAELDGARIRAEVSAEQRKLESELAPAQAALASAQSRKEQALKELNAVVNEKREIEAATRAREQYKARLEADIAALKSQHGL